jgi:putative endonuclease
MDKYNPSTRYYIYTLLSLRDYTLYTGFTTDLKQRLFEHSKGIVSSTPIRIPFKLIHYEYFVNDKDAKARELYLKSAVGKAQLINSLKTTLRDRRSMPYRF